MLTHTYACTVHRQACRLEKTGGIFPYCLWSGCPRFYRTIVSMQVSYYQNRIIRRNGVREEGGRKMQRKKKWLRKRKACLVFLPVCPHLLLNIQHFVSFGFHQKSASVFSTVFHISDQGVYIGSLAHSVSHCNVTECCHLSFQSDQCCSSCHLI